VLKILQHDKI